MSRGDGDVDEQQRAPAAGAHDELELLLADDRCAARRWTRRRRPRASKLRRQLVERDDAAAEAAAIARARSAWRLATNLVVDAAVGGARGRFSSLVSPAPMTTTCRSATPPSAPIARFDGDRRDRRAAEADRRLAGARACRPAVRR